MNSLFLQLLSAFFGVIFLALAINLIIWEWKRYQEELRKSPAFARMQLIRRVGGALIIILMAIFLYLGLSYPRFFTPVPKMFLRFWGSYSLFILILLIIGGWDLYALRREYRRRAKSAIRKNLFGINSEE